MHGLDGVAGRGLISNSSVNLCVICRLLRVSYMKSDCKWLNSLFWLTHVPKTQHRCSPGWARDHTVPCSVILVMFIAATWPYFLFQAGETTYVARRRDCGSKQGKPQTPVLTRHLARLWWPNPRNTGLRLCVHRHCSVVHRMSLCGGWGPGALDIVLIALLASRFLEGLPSVKR